MTRARGVLLVMFVLLLLLGGVFMIVRSKPEPPSGGAAIPAAPTAAATPPRAADPPADAGAAPPARRPARPRTPSPAAPSPAAATPVPVDRVTLRIETDVPGAQVFIDRQFVGAAPLTTTDVTPGTHQLNVSAPGYDGYARSIDLSPGSHEIAVRFKEVRLDARAEVIHKHRFGSCRGTLIATADGLRYETSDKGDAFSAPLTALDELQVNYLEKNLRVRPAGGRQYNFTDPEGNADRLFVFQRDVNRARERLLNGDAAGK